MSTNIKSIRNPQDGEIYISLNNLKMYLLVNINDLRASGDAFEGLKADVLQKMYDLFSKAWK